MNEELVKQIEDLKKEVDDLKQQRIYQDGIIPAAVKPRHLVAGENLEGDLYYSDGTSLARLEIGSANQVLTVSGGVPTWAAASGGALNKALSVITISNTTTETDIFSYSVAANTLGTTGYLRLVLFATYLNDSGSARDLTVNLKYGASTAATTTRSFGAGTTTWSLRFEFYLFANAATSSQKGGFTMNGRATDGSLTGDGIVQSSAIAEDSTASKTLAATVTHSAASASLTFVKSVAILESL